MPKQLMLLTCILFISSIGASQAAPLDLPGTVYIDGLPCNSACQSYMAWSRQVTMSRQVPPASAQPLPSRSDKQSLRGQSQHTTGIRGSAPKAPARVAKKTAPIRIETPPARQADLPSVERAEQKPTSSETITVPLPAPNPTSQSEAEMTPKQAAAATAVEDLTTATVTPAPEMTKADSNINLSDSTPAIPPSEETIAAAPPTNADQRVAVLVVRPEIMSATDLANKIVAIDVSPSDFILGVRTAIVAAGAADVQMSEGTTLAILRVIDGEVPAAVVIVGSPEAAEAWSGSSRLQNTSHPALAFVSQGGTRVVGRPTGKCISLMARHGR